MTETPWLRRFAERAAPAGRIVCFGPAGGSANFFRGWARHVPADVEVWSLAYPGRERRFDEPAIVRMDLLADEVTRVLAPRLDVPTVLFGHSMGASVAFEVTRRLEKAPTPAGTDQRGTDQRGTGLVGLVLSGRQSPRRQREAPTDVAGYDDEQILAHLGELGGTPPDLLADPDFRELLLPAFRSDFALVGRYLPGLEPRIATPLWVLHGDRDPGVPPGDAAGWREVADRFEGVRTFPGEHFYLVEEEADVVAHVAAFLAGLAHPGHETAHPGHVRPGPGQMTTHPGHVRPGPGQMTAHPGHVRPGGGS